MTHDERAYKKREEEVKNYKKTKKIMKNKKMKGRQRKCPVCMSFMQTGGKQTATADDADSHYMPQQ